MGLVYGSVENVALNAGSRQRMWMGICILKNLGASSGQINIIPGDNPL